MSVSNTKAVLHALEGRPEPVFADLSNWLKFGIAGSDARRWLNDLVTNRVDDLEAYQSRRTLLLDRTGRIKADVHVLGMRDGSLLIVQDRRQSVPIFGLLDRYVLSSDVDFADRTADLAVFGHPGLGGWTTGEWWAPSVLGSGADRIVPMTAREDELRRKDGWLEATEQDLEVWRIRRGAPRFGVDFGDDWLPAEAGFDVLVDTTKGCFLGQESVAKVRNLGHPPRIVQSFSSMESVTPMAAIMAGGEQVGRVTSVAANDDGSTACIGWVRWDARNAEVMAEGGLTLARRANA
jgi:folate-binding protein YgfZ